MDLGRWILIRNEITGQGTTEQPRTQSFPGSYWLAKCELEELYCTYFPRKIVDLLPQQMTQDWIELLVGGTGEGAVVADTYGYLRRLKCRKMFREAYRLARLHGDGYLIIGIDDGLPSYEPVNENAIASIDWLFPLEINELYPYESNNYLYPSTWRIATNYSRRPGEVEEYIDKNLIVHSSRILRFSGDYLPPEQRLGNFGNYASCLQSFWSALEPYLTACDGAAEGVSKILSLIYYLEGLSDIVADGTEAADKVKNRVRSIRREWGNYKSLGLDKDTETAEWVTPSLANVSNIIETLRENVVSASGIPASYLFGRWMGGGLSSDGAIDRFIMAQLVGQHQEDYFRENLEVLLRYIFLAADSPAQEPTDWELKFQDTLRLTQLEQAELREAIAKTDQIYLANQVLSVEEVRLSSFGGATYSIERNLDE